MNYSITELIDVESVQSTIDSFYDIVHFPIAFNDVKGNVLNPNTGGIVGAGWTRICREFHRSNPDSDKKCFESDTVLSKLPPKGERYTLYRCKNGLIDISIPIVIDGEHLANLFIGQFLQKPPDLDFFRRQSIQYKYDMEEYQDALSDVSVLEEKVLKPILNHMCHLADLISRIGLNEKKILDLNRETNLENNKKRITKEIIPMCCHCKEIRNPQGTWQDFGAYIRNKYPIEISHSFCPSCFKKLYPDHYKKYEE